MNWFLFMSFIFVKMAEQIEMYMNSKWEKTNLYDASSGLGCSTFNSGQSVGGPAPTIIVQVQLEYILCWAAWMATDHRASFDKSDLPENRYSRESFSILAYLTECKQTQSSHKIKVMDQKILYNRFNPYTWKCRCH